MCRVLPANANANAEPVSNAEPVGFAYTDAESVSNARPVLDAGHQRTAIGHARL
jgi:hypothetical protein